MTRYKTVHSTSASVVYQIQLKRECALPRMVDRAVSRRKASALTHLPAHLCFTLCRAKQHPNVISVIIPRIVVKTSI